MSGTRRKVGRLGPQVEGYRAWLAQRGYTPQTVRNMLKDLGQVGVWMSAVGLETDQLDEDAMVRFLAARQAAGRRRALGPRAMVPLLTYLRDAGVTPAALPPQTPAEALLAEYRTWLVRERGLAPATVLRYENTASRRRRSPAGEHAVVRSATPSLCRSAFSTGCTGAGVRSPLGRPGRQQPVDDRRAVVNDADPATACLLAVLLDAASPPDSELNSHGLTAPAHDPGEAAS
jgi:hypothetical protein